MKARTLSTGKVYIMDYARTAFSSFGEDFVSIKPVDLSVISSEALLKRNSITFENIDHTIFSNVLPSSPDTLYGARHLALKLGADYSSPGYSVNRLCGSGIQALWEAFNQIKMKESDSVLVSGAENMSMTPHLTHGARFGTKYGSLVSSDLLLDTLIDQNCNTPMGITAENLASNYSISRLECEEYVMRSHRKAFEAYSNDLFEREVIAHNNVFMDMNIRKKIDGEQLSRLKPSFKKEGVVTPATASAIVDGSASCLVCSEAFASQNEINPLAQIVDFSVVGVDPKVMGIGPVPAIRKLLAKNNLSIEDVDLFEINEAFAPQVIACIRELRIDEDRVNIWGGAISMGHPLGATGIRISGVLANQMKKLNKKWGIASACIGGGQGIAVLLKNANE